MNRKVCDICEDIKKEAVCHSFHLDRCMDGAGDMDDVVVFKDLCINCLWKHYKALEALCSFEIRQKAFKSVDK